MRSLDNLSFYHFGLIFAFFLVEMTIGNLHAQVTDTSLIMEQFGKDDLIPFLPQTDQKVYAAGRILEDVAEVPQNIYIITREEIYQEGYSTLVDILKTIPGFRTSQPGSAQLGEVFLSRGLLGNMYTTVLINGLPIKPLGAPGMPIGSQLPIKQAERIEIIMGPSSTLYGSDAMAGVINIVLPEITRPVEVSSDIRLGGNGLVEINTSLGGKLGRDRNVLMYNLYGTSKTISNYNLNTSQFVVADSVVNNPYYIGESDDPTTPEIRSIPHSSGLIGGRFKFRGFTLNLNLMSRQDHSALGAFPSRVSYSDPGNFFGENIYHAGLQYGKQFSDYWSFLINGSFVNYTVDNNSSYTGIYHEISNGRNFMYAQSTDLRLEPIFNWEKERFNLLFGMQYIQSFGVAFQNFMQNPYVADKLLQDSLGNPYAINSTDTLSRIAPISRVNNYQRWSYSTFAQLFYKREKINLLAGFRYELPDSIAGVFNPNLGIVYKPFKKLHLRGSYAHAFQVPGPYYQNYNYFSTVLSSDPLEYTPYVKGSLPLRPETLQNVEFLLDYYLSKTSKLTFSYYRHVLDNSLFTFTNFPGSSIDNTNFFALYVNRNTTSVLNGLQLSYFFQHRALRFDLHGIYHIGNEEIENAFSISSYRSVPTYTLQANVKGRLGEKNRFGVNFRFDGPFVNQIVFVNEGSVVAETAASYNIDVFYNRQFGKNLFASFKIINLTNSINKGIFINWLDGYEFDYVPQLNRWYSISLSYRLN